MEYQRVILPFSDDFESVDKPLAERLLADSIQVDLSMLVVFGSAFASSFTYEKLSGLVEGPGNGQVLKGVG